MPIQPPKTIIDFPKPPKLPEVSPGALRLVLLAIVVGWALWTGIYTIDPEEVGVELRFGAYTETTDPGLNFKIPFGIETVIPVPVQRQLKEEFGFRTQRSGVRSDFTRAGLLGESNMLTGDLNTAVVEWVVQYRIVDPIQFLFRVRNVRETLRDMSEAVMREVVGDRTVNEVLTVGRLEVADLVEEKLQELCRQYESGIEIDQVVLQNVNPPDRVKPSFNEVNEAQQEREKLINQAQSEYNKVIPRAGGRAQQTIEAAEGYALNRVNRSSGDAARFNSLYVEYRKAPEVTRKRIYLETLNKVLPKVGDKIVVDEDIRGLLPLLNLGGGAAPIPGAITVIVRVLLVAAVVVLLALVSGFAYQVYETEQVILTRFGKPVGEPVNEPGLHFKTPFILKVYRFDKRFLEWDGEANELTTRDKRFIYVDTYARWQITDPLLFFQRLRDERGAQSRLDDILNSEARNAIANHDLVELVRTTNREPLGDESQTETSETLEPIAYGRGRIREEILAAAQTRTQDLGIEILDVQFKRINYVEEVQEKVYDRMIAERRRIADRFRSEGEGESARIGGEMERELQRIESEAYREAQEIKGRADAEAASIYAAAYDQSADSRRFYEFVKSMETLEQTASDDTTIVLSTDGEFYRFLKGSGG